ncbi:MAG: hypothetical protein HRJ53_21585 [Acidobacteria bacterium Pan2503]|uniref:Uncharacterized protein n=1 Tax=Candidatus Acidiferrum panamense TaxID=2741543 RepID=A0A7V8SZ45_9BACT|nr:hypothetical protein [Candidatus Acidoferrum panamensis]
MPNYLHKAGGTLSTGFPWSIGMVSTSADSEAAAQTVWDNGIVAMWTTAAFNALVPTGTILTYTSTSTANAAFKQTTKTQTTHNTPGSATQGPAFGSSMIVTWRSASATKWGHGRWYLPAFGPTSLATAGYWLSATAVGDIVSAVNAGLVLWVGPLNFQILHRKNTLTGPTADTLTPVIGGDVSNKLAIQRRRGDKFVPTRSNLTY